jgi:Uma2 family endonuclease
MLDPTWNRQDVPQPDVSHIATEDGAPVDGIFSEKQMRLLAHVLYAAWKPEGGRAFSVFANVGLFSSPDAPPLVPDVMVSLDVQTTSYPREKKERTYFIWVHRKSPEVVIEVVSNREGGEVDKLIRYAEMGVAYAVIHDPDTLLSNRVLRVYELRGRHFVDMLPPHWLSDLGLGLTLWEGSFEGMTATWLRWCDAQGRLLPTGCERAEAAHERAEAEHERAEAAHGRAEAERERADRLAARLRDLGAEP